MAKQRMRPAGVLTFAVFALAVLAAIVNQAFSLWDRLIQLLNHGLPLR